MPVKFVQNMLLLIVFVTLSGMGRAARAQAPPSAEAVDVRWLDRLRSEDRACVERTIGYSPPAFDNDLEWVNREPMRWDDLRGEVVVIQSWTTRTAAGRNWAMRIGKVLERFDPEDLELIALHTPEGADQAHRFLERRPLAIPTVIDRTGEFCDALGMYKRPVNLVVDRNGTVRYAGLSLNGLLLAVEKLVAEEANANVAPIEMPRDVAAATSEFPPFQGQVGSAIDIRGSAAPDLYVEHWINAKPSSRDKNKVIIVEFWATSCGPCISNIPHMNELADTFRDDVAIIGIAGQQMGKFQSGMETLRQSKGVTVESFRYHIAIDSQMSMQKSIRNTGIPHAMVISSDWIVRWQGHPASLNEQTLGRIVAANKALNGEAGSACDRWAMDR